MTNLMIILGLLFLSLFIIIAITERYAKPLQADTQNKLSRVFVVLMICLLLASSLKFSDLI